MSSFPKSTAVPGRRPSRLLSDARPPDGQSGEESGRTGLMSANPVLLETIRSYDVSAQEYADRFADADLRLQRQRFVSLIPAGDGPVLDAGCGPGRDCELFSQSGLRMVGADISAALLKIAAQRTHAKLVRCDLRLLPFADQSFQGVWSCASLVHLAAEDAEHAVREFCRVLIPRGTMFLSVRHGTGQEWRTDSNGGRRWFQLYERDVLERIVTSSGFSIIESEVAAGVVVGQWVNMFARKA